jgi:hypothetical protein
MILYRLTAYCSVCGHDFAESDDEDIEPLAAGITYRAEVLHAQHVAENRCA